jgi:hypothetical protein
MTLGSQPAGDDATRLDQWWTSLNVALVLMIFLIATQAHQLQDVVLDEREPALWIFVQQLLQPLTW